MRTFGRLVILAAIAGLQPAIAQIETVINAVETAPANIILPASNNGMMTFRPCDGECDDDHVRVRVTPETTFSVDGSGVKWEDFRNMFPNVRQSDSGYALVSYDTRNKVLISLEVSQ